LIQTYTYPFSDYSPHMRCRDSNLYHLRRNVTWKQTFCKAR